MYWYLSVCMCMGISVIKHAYKCECRMYTSHQWTEMLQEQRKTEFSNMLHSTIGLFLVYARFMTSIQRVEIWERQHLIVLYIIWIQSMPVKHKVVIRECQYLSVPQEDCRELHYIFGHFESASEKHCQVLRIPEDYTTFSHLWHI